MKNINLKTKETNSKGITLVALIITIIILLILATVSISLLINEGIIGKSAQAVFRTEIEQYNEELKLAITEDKMNNLGFRDNKFNVRRSTYDDENTFTNAMKSKIPSFNKKYANKLEIKEDQLNYIGEDEQERTWLAQVISVAGMLRISYVYENGTEAAPMYQKVITDGSYEVESPTISGYEPDHYIVSGEINGDTNITVTYYPLSQGLEYELLSDGTYTVAAIGNFTGEGLVIPAEYNGKAVTEIKTSAFYNNKKLKYVNIPATIKKVKYEAFNNCSNIESIYLNAETTEEAIFENCTNLNKAEIGSNVKTFGGRAFWKCSNLSDVTIYTEQANINTFQFCWDCMSLQTIIINEDNNRYKVIDGVLYSKDSKKIYMYSPAREGEYVIPDTVEEIGDYAFCDCKKLIKINITDKIKTIGTEAFYSSDLLEEININAKTIGSYSFEKCPNLKNVTIGTNVNKIMSRAFSRSTNIEEFKYLGTKEQWNNITKADGWTRDSNITQVICSDGIVDV